MKNSTIRLITTMALSILVTATTIIVYTPISADGAPKCGASEDVRASKEIRGGGKGFGNDRSEFAKSEPRVVGGENTRSALDFNPSPNCGGPANPPPSDVYP